MSRSMTEGNPFKAISLFAIPLFIGIFFQQVYTLVDSIVVGKFVGATALGAIGACGGSFNLIISLLSGLTGGAGVIIAQYYGAQNERMLKASFVSSMIVNVAAGIFLTVIGLIFTRPLIHLLNTPEKLIKDAVIYLTIMCAGILANCLYNGMSAVLRSTGNSVTPLIALVLASILNVLLDLLFVLAFNMGVAGVAVATIISQLVSAVFLIIYTFVKYPHFRFGMKDLKLDLDITKIIINIGVPSALTSSCVSISVMFMQRAINNFGEIVVTGYTVGGRAENLCMGLSIAIGLSVGTFCGQNIGAQKFDRVKDGLRIGVIVSFIYCFIFGAIVIIFAGPLAGLFTNDPQVIAVAKQVIYITSPFHLVLGQIFVFREFLKSAGDIAPTVWMSITEIVARSVLAFIFAAIWGYVGIWWVTPIGWIATLIIGIIRYKSGVWKTKIKLKQ